MTSNFEVGRPHWRRMRGWLATFVLLTLTMAGAAAAQPAEVRRGARIGPELTRALERPFPAEGLAKFDALVGTMLEVFYENDEVTVYKVVAEAVST